MASTFSRLRDAITKVNDAVTNTTMRVKSDCSAATSMVDAMSPAMPALWARSCGSVSLALDASPNRSRGNVATRQRCAHRNHPAADIDTDRGGDDRAVGGEHGSDGCALAVVTIRHDSDMLEHERHARRVHDLLLRFVFDRAPRQKDDRVLANAFHISRVRSQVRTEH